MNLVSLALQEAPAPPPEPASGLGSFLSGTPWIDLVGLGVVTLFFLLGLRHGLVWQVTRLIGMLVALALARGLSPELTPHVEQILSLPIKACQGIVWFLIFAGTLIVTAMIGMVGRRALEAVHLGTMDRMGGGLAGAVTGVIVHCAVLVLLSSVGTAEWASNTFKGSASASMLDSLSRKSKILLDAQAAERIMEPWGKAYDADLAQKRRDAEARRLDEERRQSAIRAQQYEQQLMEERRRAAELGYRDELERRRDNDPRMKAQRRGVR